GCFTKTRERKCRRSIRRWRRVNDVHVMRARKLRIQCQREQAALRNDDIAVAPWNGAQMALAFRDEEASIGRERDVGRILQIVGDALQPERLAITCRDDRLRRIGCRSYCALSLYRDDL